VAKVILKDGLAFHFQEALNRFSKGDTMIKKALEKQTIKGRDKEVVLEFKRRLNYAEYSKN